ncbi:hypothetical protein [Neisseria polysaccharea]|nr:hypothetical protein [Neisseria polysaccharea]
MPSEAFREFRRHFVVGGLLFEPVPVQTLSVTPIRQKRCRLKRHP